MDRDIERESLIGSVEQSRQKNEVAGRRDGKKLGNSLDKG